MPGPLLTPLVAQAGVKQATGIQSSANTSISTSHMGQQAMYSTLCLGTNVETRYLPRAWQVLKGKRMGLVEQTPEAMSDWRSLNPSDKAG